MRGEVHNLVAGMRMTVAHETLCGTDGPCLSLSKAMLSGLQRTFTGVVMELDQQMLTDMKRG